MRLVLILLLFRLAQGHLSKLELPEYAGERCTPLNNGTHSVPYDFVPISTIVGFVFVGLWLSFILIAKIFGNSSDKYKMNNKFDLVIFKPATSSKQDSLIGQRRVVAHNVYSHNINAANACGFDFNLINARTSFSELINNTSSDLGTPITTNANSLSKL